MEIKPLEKWQVEAACGIYRMNNPKKPVQDFKMLVLASIDNQNRRRYLGADECGELQGFIGFGQSHLERGVYGLFHLNVAPNTQLRNVSTNLVKRALHEIKSNEDSRLVQVCVLDPRFYTEQFGFEETRLFDRGNAYLLTLGLRADG